MFQLIESDDKEFLEDIAMALDSYGVEASVYYLGPNSEGVKMFSVCCPASSSQKAISLVDHSHDFLFDVGNESSFKLSMYRNENSSRLGKFLTSKKMLVVSAIALIVLISSLFFE